MNTRLVALLCFAAIAVGQDDKTLLSDSDPAKRESAAERLADRGAAGAVSELAECLVDTSPQLRVLALRALATAGDAAKPALPEIVRMIRDSQANVRVQAFVTLARLGEVDLLGKEVNRDYRILKILGQDHDDTLRALLTAKSWHVRNRVLGIEHVRRGATADWIEPIAKLAASDPTDAVRRTAIMVLTNASAPVAPAHFVACLDDPGPHIRICAVIGLSREPKLEAAVVSRMENLLEDAHVRVRQYAAYALRDRPESHAKVAGLLHDDSKRVRAVARAVLAIAGKWPKDGSAELMASALNREIEPAYPFAFAAFVRGPINRPFEERVAKEALLASGQNAVKELLRAYGAATEESRRVKIIDVLGILKQADAIERALQDKSLEVRRRAAANRAFLGKADDSTLKILIGCLEETGRKPERPTQSQINWARTSAGLLVALEHAAVPALKAQREKLRVRAPANRGAISRIDAVLERIQAEQ